MRMTARNVRDRGRDLKQGLRRNEWVTCRHILATLRWEGAPCAVAHRCSPLAYLRVTLQPLHPMTLPVPSSPPLFYQPSFWLPSLPPF